MCCARRFSSGIKIRPRNKTAGSGLIVTTLPDVKFNLFSHYVLLADIVSYRGRVKRLVRNAD